MARCVFLAAARLFLRVRLIPQHCVKFRRLRKPLALDISHLGLFGVQFADKVAKLEH